LVDALEPYRSMDVENCHADMMRRERESQKLEKEWEVVSAQIESVQTQIDHMVTHDFDPECGFCIQNNQKTVQTVDKLQKMIVEQKERRETIHPQVQELRELMENYADVVEDYGTFVTTDKELAEVNRQLLSGKAKISECKNRVITKRAKLKEVDLNIRKYYQSIDIIEKNAEIDGKIGDLEQLRSELEGTIKLCETKLRDLHGKLQVEKAHKAKILKQITDMEDLEQTVIAYQYYIEAVKRDGVPYELISKVIPSIESEVNHILSQITDFTVELDVDGKNINGRISYGDDRSWPLEMSSGMERFISSLAIRAALITVSNLPKPNFLIIDEGLSVLSSENLMSMTQLFSILKSQFDFIITISHLEAVRDMVENLMEIQIDNGYSKINY